MKKIVMHADPIHPDTYRISKNKRPVSIGATRSYLKAQFPHLDADGWQINMGSHHTFVRYKENDDSLH